MKTVALLFTFSMFISISCLGQSKSYWSYSGEMIFSFAGIEYQGQEPSSLMRWAPVFNIQTMWNSNMSPNFGFFTGGAIRNVGYIFEGYDDPVTDVSYKKKFRSYNLGIPVGMKIGNLEKLFFFGGYEIEFPFHYKEKTFDDGDKIDKITGWFSNRQEPIQHGFLAGIQFPQGINLKFKYYLSEFHNQEFEDGAGIRPYDGLKANIFYFSLSYGLFTDFDWEWD